MIQLHAQPYDLSATGFYFENAEDYAAKAKNNTNDYGDPVEEYEIQFIDGGGLDCALASAWGLSQVNFPAYLEATVAWDDGDKLRYIIAVGECGYAHDQAADTPSDIDLTLYEISTMRELAEQFVDEGLFGEVPKPFRFYIDYDAIARDLAVNYAETTIAGTHYIYRCA